MGEEPVPAGEDAPATADCAAASTAPAAAPNAETPSSSSVVKDAVVPPLAATIAAPPPAAVSHGPTVVLPPGGAVVPPPEEEVLPPDSDGDGWLELLRDGFARQLREENECEEPPAFHRAMLFAADPGLPIPKGKFPRQSLNAQLQLLFRLRGGTDGPQMVMPGKGCGKHPMSMGKGKVAPPGQIVVGGAGQLGKAPPNPHMLKTMHTGGIRLPMQAAQMQRGQILMQAAALKAGKGGQDKGGKFGIQRTIGK